MHHVERRCSALLIAAICFLWPWRAVAQNVLPRPEEPFKGSVLLGHHFGGVDRSVAAADTRRRPRSAGDGSISILRID